MKRINEDYEDECESAYEIPQDYDFDNDFLAGDLVADLTALATQYVDSFFQGRDFHSGGEVPGHLLHSQKRISRVLNTDIDGGVTRAYDALKDTISDEEHLRCKQFGIVSSDIKFVNEMLNDFAKLGIPKVFAGGMLLMFLEFCEGMKVHEP